MSHVFWDSLYLKIYYQVSAKNVTNCDTPSSIVGVVGTNYYLEDSKGAEFSSISNWKPSCVECRMTQTVKFKITLLKRLLQGVPENMRHTDFFWDSLYLRTFQLIFPLVQGVCWESEHVPDREDRCGEIVPEIWKVGWHLHA